MLIFYKYKLGGVYLKRKKLLFAGIGFLSAATLFGLSIPQVFAATTGASTTASTYVSNNTKVSPNTSGPYFFWKITGTGSPTTAQSEWHIGDQGVGPAGLTFSQTIGVSNGLSGTVHVSIADVSSAVGFSVTASYSQNATYSITIPAGETEQIQWAGVYLHKNVYQTEYEDGEGMLPRPINYATANASKFDYFTYRSVQVY
jgi:hypothetical protein